MKCEKCRAEFTIKEQAKAKGCCPSCGEKIPVSEYCHGVPDRRWWRLFRGAPIGLKLSAIFLILLCCYVVLNSLLIGLPLWMVESRVAIIHGGAMCVALLLMFSHMLKATVRGAIPYVCIMALGALGWGAADSFCESLVVFLPLTIFLLSFVTPASRRWGRKIREEDIAYWIAARSGAFPFWRMVAKCILKKIVIGALFVVCLGTYAYTPESIERMCDWLKNRLEEVMSCLYLGTSRAACRRCR